MRNIITVTLFFTVLSCYYLSFGQDTSHVNLQDSVTTNIQKTARELNQLKKELERQTEKTQSFLTQSERNFELAGKIIDWSAMFFAVLIVVLGIAGWIGARRFKQIDETAREMAELLEKMKNELQGMQDLRKENQIAINEFKIGIEKDRKEIIETLYYMNEGDLAYEQGEIERAIESYNKVIALNPKSPEANYMLGNAYSANGEYEKAITYLKKAIELKPDYFEAYYNLGRTYRRSGDFDLAIDSLKKSMEINSKFVPTIENLGHTYFEKGEIEKAIEWYQKTLSIDSNHATAYMSIARIYYQKGETEKALKYYIIAKEKLEQILSEGRYRHWHVYRLGEVYLVLNDFEKAMAYYEKAFGMNSAQATLRAIMKNLNLLKFSPTPPKDIDKIIKFYENKLA